MSLIGAVKVTFVEIAQRGAKNVVTRARGGAKACAKDACRFAECGKEHAREDRDQA